MMSSLIDGVLQYSKAGCDKTSLEQIDLNELVLDVISVINAPDDVHISIENKLPVIPGYRIHFEQIFQNLLSNAVRYMDIHNGIIKITCIENNSFWKIGIIDNGPGIPPEFQTKIFEIFQTIDSRDKKDSTGIGLSIVKKIIEMHGGSICVESKNRGSTFFFTVPKNAT